jgi:putative monooxygenase
MAEAKMVKISALKPYPPPGHTHSDTWLLIGKDFGAKNIVVWLTEMRPEAVAEKHIHPFNEHAYIILSGRGRITAGGKTFDLEPGVAVFVPPGLEHETVTIGRETLRMIVILAPPP